MHPQLSSVRRLRKHSAPGPLQATVHVDRIGFPLVLTITSKSMPHTSVTKEFHATQKDRLVESLRHAGIKAYDEQRARCVDVLENQAGIQCYDHETLDQLIEAVATNINDGTLAAECLTV